MTNIVIGMGEIGKAVKRVLSDTYEGVNSVDRNDEVPGKFDVLHICFPYSEKFIESVNEYKKTYLKRGGLVVIHSTVPVGTSKKLGAVHSPVRGRHPNLYDSIKNFVKYFGGGRSREAKALFMKCGVEGIAFGTSEETEALKLWDTTIYFWNVALMWEIHEWCASHGIPFDSVYTEPNQTYNEGYEIMGHPEFKKYVLKYTKGKVGGHCLEPNCRLLDSWVCDLLLRENDKRC